MELNQRQQELLKRLSGRPDRRISEIKELLTTDASIPTLNRDLKDLVNASLLIKSGSGRNTVYRISDSYRLLNAEIGDSTSIRRLMNVREISASTRISLRL